MTGQNCKICTRPVQRQSGFYGAQSCAACATFFLRARNRTHEYKCRNKNNNLCLTIPSQKGARCQKCRLQKCFEIGMSSSNKNRKNAVQNFEKEYLNLAKKIYAIFTIVTQNPQYLFEFFVLRNDKSNLLIEVDQLISKIELNSKIDAWAKLFYSNQIPMNEVYLLLYGILANIKFPWLSMNTQKLLSDIQGKAIERFLQPSAYSSSEIKEGFEKITKFFCKEYLKIFVFKKLQTLGALK